jgi:hypothetical protein
MEREAAEAGKEGAAAARRKAENAKYRAQLEAQVCGLRGRSGFDARDLHSCDFSYDPNSQLHLAAEETSWMDKHFAAEHENEWARRQAKWDAEAAAREALMRDVSAVRAHQVEDRIRAKEEERVRDAAQVAIWREQQAAASERDAAVQAERRRKLALQQSYTVQQLAENEAARAAAAQATYLEARMAEKVERDYQARVDALLQEPLPEKTLHVRKKTGLW